MSQGKDWIEGGNQGSQPQGMGTGAKVLIGLLIFGGICALACCGIGGFMYYQIQKGMQITMAPAEVSERTQEIVTIKVPEKFQPQMAMKFDMLGKKFSMATYQAAAGDGNLVVVEVPTPFEQAKASGDEQIKQIQEMQKNQAGGPAAGGAKKDIEISEEDTEHKEREIRGQKVQVTYSKGTEAASKKEYRMMNVVLPSKAPDSSVTISVQLPESEWKDEEIEAMLDSIQ